MHTPTSSRCLLLVDREDREAVLAETVLAKEVDTGNAHFDCREHTVTPCVKNR